MMNGYSVEGDILVINRDLNELDFFVRDFLEVFKKHSDYLIVSGFVSISTGRARGTEDIDMLFPLMEEEAFMELFNNLLDEGFWCYQSDTAQGAYEYIRALSSIRFIKKGMQNPNMECIPITPERKAKYFEFNNPQKIRIGDFEFKIPPIEFEILYKELVLGSKKDLEDAMHLRVLFVDFIKGERFKEYETVIRGELK